MNSAAGPRHPRPLPCVLHITSTNASHNWCAGMAPIIAGFCRLAETSRSLPRLQLSIVPCSIALKLLGEHWTPNGCVCVSVVWMLIFHRANVCIYLIRNTWWVYVTLMFFLAMQKKKKKPSLLIHCPSTPSRAEALYSCCFVTVPTESGFLFFFKKGSSFLLKMMLEMMNLCLEFLDTWRRVYNRSCIASSTRTFTR